MLGDNSHSAFEVALRAGAYESAWRYCCRLTATSDDARDLLHDSLAHALRMYPRLRKGSSLRGWLLAIVRTQFLSGLRSKRLTVPLEDELLGQLEAPPDAEHELVLACLRGMPAAQRELLELFYIEDLSLAELGTVLGIPAVAARHRLHRARESLRKQVQLYSEEESLSNGEATCKRT